jgi:arsenite methyltransferase
MRLSKLIWKKAGESDCWNCFEGQVRKTAAIKSISPDASGWQQDNHAIQCSTPEILKQKMNYIHENPVRAGFVEKAEDWLWRHSSFQSTHFQIPAELNDIRPMKSLADDLNLLSKLFDLDQIANENVDAHSVSRYYRWTNWFYRRFHSHEGAMHFPIYLPGQAKNHFEGLAEQARLIGEYVKPKQFVAEIGCGFGYNLRQLVKIQPEIKDVGVDASASHVKRAIRFAEHEHLKLEFKQGIFSQLPLADSLADVVFAVESFCYSKDIKADLTEVHRVLKAGGVFIVFDLFRQPQFDLADDSNKLASLLSAKGFAVAQWQKLDEWLAIAERLDFQVLLTADLSSAITPNVIRIQKDSRKFIERLTKFQLIKNLVPDAVLRHAISGLLGPHLLAPELHGYYQVVLRKMA